MQGICTPLALQGCANRSICEESFGAFARMGRVHIWWHLLSGSASRRMSVVANGGICVNQRPPSPGGNGGICSNGASQRPSTFCANCGIPANGTMYAYASESGNSGICANAARHASGAVFANGGIGAGVLPAPEAIAGTTSFSGDFELARSRTVIRIIEATARDSPDESFYGPWSPAGVHELSARSPLRRPPVVTVLLSRMVPFAKATDLEPAGERGPPGVTCPAGTIHAEDCREPRVPTSLGSRLNGNQEGNRWESLEPISQMEPFAP